MSKYEVLEDIKQIWSNDSLSLTEKVRGVSNAYYSIGLDLLTAATYIKETPAELDAILSLGALEDDILERISEINPPKTTWPLLANASREESLQALSALEKNKTKLSEKQMPYALSQFVYSQMVEVSGPTSEQKIGMISGDDLFHLWEKNKSFKALSDKEAKFLGSVAHQRKRGKTLTPKQLKWLNDILLTLRDKKVIQRDSIDGDQEICNRILDLLE